MISPPELTEVEFTLRCKIATYNPQDLFNSHTQLDDVLKQRLRDFVGQHGVVSSPESRMEKL